MKKAESRTAEAALSFLGMAARAGQVVSGTARVREAVRAGSLLYVLVAEDASANTHEKLLPLLLVRRVPHGIAFRREQLGSAIGHAPLSAVGLTGVSFAERLQALVGKPE